MTARKVIGCKRQDGGAGCSATLGCSGCHKAIYEQEDTPPAFGCQPHHAPCGRPCHHQNVAVLIKAALDSATELDGLRAAWAASYPNDEVVQESAERHGAIVERVYNACEALGEKIGISVDEEQKLCQHVVVVADECAICGCEVTA